MDDRVELSALCTPVENVLVYHPSPQKAAAYQRELEKYGIHAAAASTPDEAQAHVSSVEMVLGWGFPVALMQKARALRWVQVTGAGVDHLLAHNEQIPPEVVITRIVDQFGSPMSEYVFTYLLHLCKSVEPLLQAQREKRWSPIEPGTLSGKTMGVAGLGSIGREIVRKARAFDMTVYGLSHSGKYRDVVDQHFTTQEWLTFVEDLDVLVLVLPLTEETRHVVNKAVLEAMKTDAILVNVGRGGLVDESALVNTMRENRLQAAILDVFEEEPLPEQHPFWTLPGVYVTPHSSGVSSIPAVTKYFVENVQRLQNGLPLVGVVNRTFGY